MTSITRRCRSVRPELSARIPGGRPGRDRLGPSGFVASFIACTGSSRLWERSWAVMVALSAVVVTSAPLDGLPCSATVVAFERLRQTHVRVKNCGRPAAIRCLGVWLTSCRADKRVPHCALLAVVPFPAGAPTSWAGAQVCHLDPRQPGIAPPPRAVLTVSPHVPSGTAVPDQARRDGVAVRHPPIPVRHARTRWMYGPIPTSSGWIAAVAQKLWSPGSSTPQASPMLGAASRGSRAFTRPLSLL